jgi:hypothetical protein
MAALRLLLVMALLVMTVLVPLHGYQLQPRYCSSVRDTAEMEQADAAIYHRTGGCVVGAGHGLVRHTRVARYRVPVMRMRMTTGTDGGRAAAVVIAVASTHTNTKDNEK